MGSFTLEVSLSRLSKRDGGASLPNSKKALALIGVVWILAVSLAYYVGYRRGFSSTSRPRPVRNRAASRNGSRVPDDIDLGRWWLKVILGRELWVFVFLVTVMAAVYLTKERKPTIQQDQADKGESHTASSEQEAQLFIQRLVDYNGFFFGSRT